MDKDFVKKVKVNVLVWDAKSEDLSDHRDQVPMSWKKKTATLIEGRNGGSQLIFDKEK